MVDVWDEVRDDLANYRRISLMTVRDETGTDKIVKLDVTEVNYVFPVFNLVPIILESQTCTKRNINSRVGVNLNSG